MKYLRILLIFVFVLSPLFIASKGYCEEKAVEKKEDRPLAVAIFSRNKTRDAKYDKYAEMLRSALVSQLSDKFTIIDKDDVINIFEKESKKEKVSGVNDFWGFVNKLTEMKKEEKAADREDNVDNRTIDQKSSALRISQMIGANYFLIADLDEIVSNNIRDEVYGNKINDYRITADISVKILDGIRGGSILADSVRSEKRLHGDEKTNFTKEDIMQTLPLLMKQAAKDISKKFLENIEKVREFKLEGTKVKFSVKSNVDKVTVELDGAAIGTAPGTFESISGLHRIRLTKDGYRSFERDVNLLDNAVINVSLEETGESIERQGAKQDLELKKEKAEADNYSTKERANAQEKWGTPKKEDEKW